MSPTGNSALCRPALTGSFSYILSQANRNRWPRQSNGEILIQALDLRGRPNTFIRLKTISRKVAEENLDVTRLFSEQDAVNLAEVRGRISQYLPDVFEDPSVDEAARQRRMECAMCYVRKYFAALRYRKSKIKRIAAAKKLRPEAQSEIRQGKSQSSARCISAASPLRDTSPTQPRRVSPRLHASSRHNRFTPGTAGATPCEPAPSSSLPSYSSGPRSMCSTQPARTKPLSGPSSVSATTPSTPSAARSTTTSASSSSAPAPSPTEYHVDEVVTFLRSCNPDMQYLLNSFISFGCRNRHYLAAVAKWSDDEIDDFLKKVITHTPPEEAPCLEMEFWILKKHFRQSFSGGSGTRGDMSL